MSNERLHPDLSERGKYAIGIDLLVENVLSKLDSIEGHGAPSRVVIAAIFNVVDGWLANRMIWADPVDTLWVWCKSIGVDYGNLRPNNPHAKIVSYIELEVSELLLDVLPNRTWRILSVRRIGDSNDLIVEIGEDYRIADWMKQHGSEYTR